MNIDKHLTTQSTLRGVIGMGFAVFFWSWQPLVVALVGITVGPFLFQLWHELAAAALWIIYLLWFHPDLARRSDLWMFIIRRLPTVDGLLSVLNSLFIVFFVWATVFIDTAVVTVVTAALSTLLFVWLRQRHDRLENEHRYERLSVSDWLLLVTAVLGIALVIFAQSANLLFGDSGMRTLFGFLLAAASAVCGSWLAHRFKLGTALHRRIVEPGIHSGKQGTKHVAVRTEVACLLAVSTVTNVVSTLLILPFAFLDVGKSDGLFAPAIGGVVALGIVGAIGSIFFRHANMITEHLGINAFDYLTPGLSLIWLAAFATVDVYRPDWLVLGAVFIIAVNALINFRSEDRGGLKWLVMALIGFGFFVLMRDEWLLSLPGVWFPDFGGYYSLIGLIATAYILILSFRTSRLVTRTTDEDKQIIFLYRELHGLVHRGALESGILREVRAVGTAKQVAGLRAAYREASRMIASSIHLDPETANRLNANLDLFAYSKQRGRGLAEQVVLWILAVSIVLVTLFTRPDGLLGWSAFLNDVFCTLFSSIALFTARHLYDLRHDRDRPILLDEDDRHAPGVRFAESERAKKRTLRLERTISICMVIAVICAFVSVMAFKWLVE